MRNALTILTTIGKDYNVTRESRDNDLRDFIDDLKENIFSEYGNHEDGGSGAINYIDDEVELDLNTNSDEVVLGIEQPEKLLSIVKAWNPEIQEKAYKALSFYQDKADVLGVSLAEYFKNIPMDELVRTYRLSDVRNAFEELSGMFCYGQNKLVYAAEQNIDEYPGCFNGTIIYDELLKDILEHPEAYALITVYYD